MPSRGVPPGDVHSPRQHWSLITVLDDGIADNCALALGRWDMRPVLAVRWNGEKEGDIGNPQSRGLPTWFILPEKYTNAILEHGGLDPDKVTLARSFIPK